MKKITIVFLASVVILGNAMAQKVKTGEQKNVIYGMISGMALLMDVYQPKDSNHKGIIFIAGSGFGISEDYQKTYNQVPLKGDYFLDPGYAGKWAQELVKRGYTVFMVDHRFSPRFQYPDAVEDVRRAVRYIRYNAARFNIGSDRIGAMGHSSGGNLASMLGVVDEVYPNTDKNPVDSVSSKVQAVVSMAAPFVLSDFDPSQNTTMYYDHALEIMQVYMGEEVPDNFTLTGKYAEASPLTHISKGDAPTMIYASEDDPLIPPRQAATMYERLKENNVEARLVIDTGSGHEPKIDMDAVDLWFGTHL